MFSPPSSVLALPPTWAWNPSAPLHLCQVPSPHHGLLFWTLSKNANQAKLQCLHISVAWLSTDVPLPLPPGGLKTQPGELDPVPFALSRDSHNAPICPFCPSSEVFLKRSHWGPRTVCLAPSPPGVLSTYHPHALHSPYQCLSPMTPPRPHPRE